ncbi:MAG TPA: DUF937 domain-containing protein [Saprospiraceae bacterium]|nr:DUF937 domain-containing protein [Saprospiraceae bacterium]
MEIKDVLSSILTQQNVQQLSQQAGIDDPQKTQMATTAIFDTLLGALSQNAKSEQGAQGIYQALKKDHDGSILNDPMGFLMGLNQPDNMRMLNGSGILGHLLGSNMGNVAGMISKATGLDQRTVQRLMPMIAPLVMGAAGKMMREKGSIEQAEPQQVRNMLDQTVEKEKKGNPMMDLAAKFLDQDNDGSVVDDLFGMASKFLRK